MKRSLLLATISFLVLSSPFCLNADMLFSDGFESGTFSSLWGSKASVGISSDRASSGTYSAKFSFPTADSWSELRFDLKNLYPELWIKFKVFFPSDYTHMNSANNKFFRLWGVTYDDYEKIGASMWGNSNNLSALIGDWNSTGSGIGPSGNEYPNFVTSSDLGKWMEIKIHAKAATSTQKGTLQIWKNGTLAINNSGTVNSYRSGEAHAYRYGYLLGWANSGFPHVTYLYIDDVVFGTAEADLGGTTNQAPLSPSGLRSVP